MNTDTPLERLKALFRNHDRLAVWSPGSPDPDFLASAEVLRQMGGEMNCRVVILGAKPLSLEVNRRLIRDFSIPYRMVRSADFETVKGLILVDYPREVLPEGASTIPLLLHIDHHRPGDGNGDELVRILDSDAGAVSTMVTEWLRDCGESWCEKILKVCATPLYYAIQADTDSLLHAGERDRVASEFLKPMCDESWLKKNLRLRLDSFQRERLKWGIERSLVEEGVLYCGLGILPSTDRDLIAISADLLSKRKGVELTSVYALIQGKDQLTLDVSLRTRKRHVDLFRLIRRITSEGGARHFKGAYQINLDYFLPSVQSDELWNVVDFTTRKQIRKAIRTETERKGWFPIGSWVRRLERLFKSE